MFALLREFRERRFTRLTDADAPVGDEEVALLEGDPGCVPTRCEILFARAQFVSGRRPRLCRAPQTLAEVRLIALTCRLLIAQGRKRCDAAGYH